MSVPVKCQTLADEIESLLQRQDELQAQLDSASPGEKSGIIRRVMRLGSLINAKEIALNACIVQYGGPPPPQPIASSFMGTMSLTTDSNFKGEPFVAPTAWGLLFDGPRTQVFVTAFPSWVIDTTSAAPPQFGFMFGTNITTITHTSGVIGGYSKADGNLGLTLMLRFDHSRDMPFYEEDSDLSIVLSTTSPQGSPVTAAGQVTLSGRGVFSGGWLNGVPCKMVVTGILSPVP